MRPRAEIEMRQRFLRDSQRTSVQRSSGDRSQELRLIYVKGAVAVQASETCVMESRGMARCLLRAEFEKMALAADT